MMSAGTPATMAYLPVFAYESGLSEPHTRRGGQAPALRQEKEPEGERSEQPRARAAEQ